MNWFALALLITCLVSYVFGFIDGRNTQDRSRRKDRW